MWFRNYILSFCLLGVSICTAQQAVIDSLDNIISLNKRDILMARALNSLSREYMRRDSEKTKEYAWRAKALSKQIGSDVNLSASYSQLVNLYKSTTQRDSAEFYLSSLKNLAANASKEDFDKINVHYNSTAGLYYKSSGKTKEALPYLLKAYELAKREGDIENTSGQALNIGNSYTNLSDYKKSLEYFLIALKGFESVGSKAGLSFCYNNISNCYYELNQYEQSLEYLNKSIILKKELGDKRGLANSEQNLGNIYMGLDKLDKAEKHINNAVTMNLELNNLIELTNNYFNLGRLHTEKGEHNIAIDFFNKSKQLAIKNKDSTMIVKNDLELLASKKRTDDQPKHESGAVENLLKLKEAGQKYNEAYGYKNLADYYAQTQQFEKALEYSNMFHKIRDSIKSTEIQAQFKTIEEQYNKDKNEKEIALLQKDQQINEQKLNRQRFLMIIFGLVILFIAVGIYMFINRSRLKQRLKELELRNRIAADLHDEVGSSLSSIYMLSQMVGKDKFETKVDILDRVKTNAKETMERMGDIVWMIKPSENEGEELKYRMQRFVHEICNSQEINCNFKADDLDGVKLSMKQKKNVYLIFKEAVNNAIKYSNTNNLDIRITYHNKELEMVIQDYGKGFDKKTILKGYGLENMQNRANDIKGALQLKSRPGQGTEVQLIFPIN